MQPTIDDIQYLLTQLQILRSDAIVAEPDETTLYRLTDDIQSIIDYYCDYFEIGPI